MAWRWATEFQKASTWHILPMLSIQTESSDPNEIRSNDTRARSNAGWKCGEVGNFHGDCIEFGASSQSRGGTNTVIGQMMHTITANSPVAYIIYVSIERNKECQGCKKTISKCINK